MNIYIFSFQYFCQDVESDVSPLLEEKKHWHDNVEITDDTSHNQNEYEVEKNIEKTEDKNKSCVLPTSSICHKYGSKYYCLRRICENFF